MVEASSQGCHADMESACPAAVEIECAALDGVCVIEAEEETLPVPQPTRKKLYFNPKFFDPELLSVSKYVSNR